MTRRQYLIAFAIPFWSIWTTGESMADEIVGRASVIDGDTIEIHGERIRLASIDAPETGQTCQDAAGAEWRCGVEAARLLDRMLLGKIVSCESSGRDRYRRLIASCTFPGEDGHAVSVNGLMVYAGFALAYRRYGREHVAAEDDARLARRGMWAGEFETPEDWRRRNR